MKKVDNRLQLVHDGQTKFYALRDITELSLARKTALDAQMIFADGAITKDLLKAIAKEAIKDIDEKKSIVNQSVYWNNILYRCSYPIDEDVSLRAAACVVFLEGEDIEGCSSSDIDKKVQLMKADQKAMDFFLPMGIELIPAYKPFVKGNFQNYFQTRRQVLKSLTPQP